ncbi:MAG: hypothetical protein ABI231_11435, partial [Candidatus Tumulicola sp.]
SDAALGQLLDRTPRLVRLRRTALSNLYELPGSAGATYVARANPTARLYSRLARGEVAVDASGAARLALRASALTADPRLDWVAGTLGWRYRAWLPDSIYPFVWTLSGRPFVFDLPASAGCVMAGALPRGATLRAGLAAAAVLGTWKPYPVARFGGAGTLLPAGGDVTAIAERACAPSEPAPKRRSVFVFASGYDAGWRAIDRGRLVAPEIANGWMMAWDATVASERLIYLPGILQAAGIVLTLVVLAIAVPLARRADATCQEHPKP